ncbi:MAG: hypothetical protein HY291_19115 [Planctomycetes bacterium]|nr:hypothetical protein [Planctomycetota bacterium]
MEESTKKRGWFQLHLSTLFVLMVMASLLVLINLIGRTENFCDVTTGGIVCGSRSYIGFPANLFDPFGLIVDILFFFGALSSVAWWMEKFLNAKPHQHPFESLAAGFGPYS